MGFEGEGGESALYRTVQCRYTYQHIWVQTATGRVTNQYKQKAAELSTTGDDSQCGVWPFAGRIEAVASIGEKNT